MPSVAPVSSVGTTGRPGKCVAARRSTTEYQEDVAGDGGLLTGAVITLSLILSPARRRRTVSTSSPESPGRMRQLITARAVCGSALLAWPASTRVATHVVRRRAL